MVVPVTWDQKAIASNPFGQNTVKFWGGSVNWRTATAYYATIATGKIEFPTSGDRNGTACKVQV